MQTSGYAQYRRVTTETAGPGDLLLQLYRAAIKNAGQACEALDRNDVAPAHRHIMRTVDIVIELQRTLDHEQGGEVALQLDSIYTYLRQRLLTANIEKSRVPLDEVSELLRQLLSAWQVAVRESARQATLAVA